jgi:hypothetical protein
VLIQTIWKQCPIPKILNGHGIETIALHVLAKRRTQMANKEEKEPAKKKKPAQSTLKEKRAVKVKKKTSKPK